MQAELIGILFLSDKYCEHIYVIHVEISSNGTVNER